MAAVAEGVNANGFYWIRDKSDDEQPMALVTGMGRNMGIKFGLDNNTEGKVKRKTNSIDGKGGRKQGLSLGTQHATGMAVIPAQEPNFLNQQSLPSGQMFSSGSQVMSKPSLKDLCPEDKRRIANLIQELARVSEEKEESEQKLKDEQETFEKKIQQLEQQNQLIGQERESLQQQYRECQELLGLYQQYLSQQQEKLNRSITLLHQSCPHSKVPISQEAPRRSRCGGWRGTALDGSYLDHPSSGSRARDPVDGAHSCSTRTCVGPFISTEQNCEVHNRHNHHECSESEGSDLRTHRFPDRKPSTCDGSRACGGPDLKVSHRCHGGVNGSLGGVEQIEQVTPVGRENWEEKRQRLLLQKKQLEKEREKIQARLALQEEKLLLQNQQLQQSHLHHSKLQQTADFEKHQNGTSSFNKGPQSSFVVNPALSEVGEGQSHTLQASVQQPLNHNRSQELEENIQQPAHKLSQEISISRKDMATSPVVPERFRTSAPSVIPSLGLPSTPQASRLGDSLIELLDIFSPMSNPESCRPKPSSQKNFISSSVHQRSLLSPSASSQPALLDPEESQILEDIFFIC